MVHRVHVDYCASLSLLGTVLTYLSAALLFPMAVALDYGESTLPFLVALAIAVTIGLVLERLDDEPNLGNREAFLMVALTWLVVPVVGPSPFSSPDREPSPTP